jgi:transposase InsO family protein
VCGRGSARDRRRRRGTTEAHVVTAALKMAMARRSPSRELILHSDQGSQYASSLYRTLIERMASNAA